MQAFHKHRTTAVEAVRSMMPPRNDHDHWKGCYPSGSDQWDGCYPPQKRDAVPGLPGRARHLYPYPSSRRRRQ